MDFTYFGLIDSKTSIDVSVSLYKIPDLLKILAIIKGSSAQGEIKDLDSAPTYFTKHPGRLPPSAPILRAAGTDRGGGGPGDASGGNQGDAGEGFAGKV
jgi:hypothetical protein